MAGRLKVLQLCAVGFTVEKLLLPLVDEMSREYEVTVACSYDKTTDRLRDRGYKVHNINIDRKITLVGNIKSVIKLYKFMKREKFDIVHVHTPVAGILGRIAARLAHVPVVIYTAHGFYFHDNMPVVKRKAFIAVEKLGGRFSDYIFTQSREDYDTAVTTGIIAKDRIMAIGNGVNIDKFSIGRIGNDTILKFRQKFGINDGDVVVGIIGRVVREKGYVEWVQAAGKVLAKYPQVKFLAVGDTLESDRDGIKDTLDGLVAGFGIGERVIFAGSRSDIPELLSIMDIFYTSLLQGRYAKVAYRSHVYGKTSCCYEHKGLSGGSRGGYYRLSGSSW